MTEYLLAECIITSLARMGIIVPPELWKKTAIGTRFYYADFFRADTGSVLSFRISVVKDSHVISMTAFINQARFFNIDPTEILQECRL
jgi:hypothetical protein